MRSPSVQGGVRVGNRSGGRSLRVGDERAEVDAPVVEDASSPVGISASADAGVVLGIEEGAQRGRTDRGRTGPLLEMPAAPAPGVSDGRAPAAGVDAEELVGPYRLEPARGGTAAVVADCAGLLVAALVVAVVRAFGRSGVQVHRAGAFMVTTAALALCVPVVAATISATRRRTLQPQLLSAQLQALALPLAAGAAAALALWRGASVAVGLAAPRLDWVLAMCAITYVTVPSARAVHTRLQRRSAIRTRVLVVGTGAVSDRLTAQLNSMPGVTVVGCVDDDPAEPARCLGRLTDLRDLCRQESVSHVVVALSGSQPQTVVDAFRIDALRPVQGAMPITVVTPWADELPTDAMVHGLSAGLAGINFAPASAGFWSRAVKATVDRFVAALGIVCLSPLLVPVALGVRLTSPGPVFFRQERVGRNGRTFSILKFRTMRTGAVAANAGGLDGETTAGPFPKLKDDPRVTGIGRILRRTSIDELPQLWNVLRGEMSLVGPRPFMLDDAATINGWPLRRYSVRPGLTGLWQVSGRNELSFAEMCRLDQLYVNSWTLGLDFTILLRTVRVIASRQGAY